MSTVKIGIGFGIFAGGMPTPEQICAYAERAEGLGIDSIWLSDHIVSRQPSLDVSCIMAMFAARTSRIKMGPSVLTLPARNPVEVAKAYATLDYLTGGRRRVIMAVGLGSDPRDAQAAGVKPEERSKRLEEGVTILRRLWSETNVTHEGQFYRFENVTLEPRPAHGALDIWIGGRTTPALKRVAKYGDGWFPSFISADEFRSGMAELQQYAAQAGRDIDSDEAGVVLLSYLGADRAKTDAMAERLAQAFRSPVDAMRARSAIGTPEECAETLQRYIDAGCRKFVLWPIAPPEELVPQIEIYGRDVLPACA